MMQSAVFRSCLGLFLILLSFHLFAQECKCDESRVLQKKYDNYLENSKIDSAKLVLSKFKKLKSPICLSVYHSNYAFIHLRLRNYKEALKSLQREYALLKNSACNDVAFLNYYTTKGMIYADLDVYDKAIASLLEAIRIAEEANMKPNLASAYASLANVFAKSNQIQKLIYYAKKAIKIDLETKELLNASLDFYLLSSGYSNLAQTNNTKLYIDSVNFTLDSSLFYAKKSQNFLIIPNIYSNKARNYMLLNEYDIAQTYLDSSIIVSVKNFHEGSLASWYLKKADVFLLQHQYDNGLRCTDSAYKYASLVHSKSLLISIYTTRYKLYKEKKDINNALFYSEKAFALKDSLNLQETVKNMTELEKKYSQVKNEKKINELLQQKQIERFRTWLIVGVSLFAFFFLVFLYRQSVARARLRQIETEQRLNRARMNPHFIFNILSALQTLNMDQHRREEVSLYINRFSRIMRQSLESTFSELISLEQELEFLTNYLELQKTFSGNKFNYTIQIDEKLSPFETLIPGMILQPFLENSIEHGFSGPVKDGLIVVKIYLLDNRLMVEIADNGSEPKQGKDEKQHISRATQIIRDRLYLLKLTYKKTAHADFVKIPGGGMKVVLTLPLLFKK